MSERSSSVPLIALCALAVAISGCCHAVPTCGVQNVPCYAGAQPPETFLDDPIRDFGTGVGIELSYLVRWLDYAVGGCAPCASPMVQAVPMDHSVRFISISTRQSSVRGP